MSFSNKGTDSSIAMIKFVVGLERIKDTKKTGIIGIPDWFPTFYNGGTKCDMAIGPCACGAWHYIGEERNVRY